MSIERQKKLIDESGSLGLTIPGLSIDPIVNNMVSKSEELKIYKQSIDEEIKDNTDRGMSRSEAEKEAQEKFKQIAETYKKNIREVVKDEIITIKQQYKVFKEGLESIPEDVKAAIANIALPPSISAPPGAPNPIYALNLAKTTKNSIAGTLSIIIVAFTVILRAANKILFTLPESIISLFEKIKIAAGIINSIPV